MTVNHDGKSPSLGTFSQLRHETTSRILAELARRQQDEAGTIAEKPVCGSGAKGVYNTSAHVYALVLILVLSTIGMPLSPSPISTILQSPSWQLADSP